MRLTLGAPAQRQARTTFGCIVSQSRSLAHSVEFRVWRAQHQSRSTGICYLQLYQELTLDAPVIVLADTEFGTVEFLQAVPTRLAGGGGTQTATQDGRCSNSFYRHSKRGQQIKRGLLCTHCFLVLAQTSQWQTRTALCVSTPHPLF